jgi:AcrR family transcriptional regulator
VERADAVRNRELLLRTAREMLAEVGVNRVTMDGLAERAGLGKGTVFRRFGTRAGIFQALLDADERHFQERVLCGSPPLGPGADPVQRLIAYGRAEGSSHGPPSTATSPSPPAKTPSPASTYERCSPRPRSPSPTWTASPSNSPVH